VSSSPIRTRCGNQNASPMHASATGHGSTRPARRAGCRTAGGDRMACRDPHPLDRGAAPFLVLCLPRLSSPVIRMRPRPDRSS
jgi:hypothetical protein